MGRRKTRSHMQKKEPSHFTEKKYRVSVRAQYDSYVAAYTLYLLGPPCFGPRIRRRYARRSRTNHSARMAQDRRQRRHAPPPSVRREIPRNFRIGPSRDGQGGLNGRPPRCVQGVILRRAVSDQRRAREEEAGHAHRAESGRSKEIVLIYGEMRTHRGFR